MCTLQMQLSFAMLSRHEGGGIKTIAHYARTAKALDDMTRWIGFAGVSCTGWSSAGLQERGGDASDACLSLRVAERTGSFEHMWATEII